MYTVYRGTAESKEHLFTGSIAEVSKLLKRFGCEGNIVEQGEKWRDKGNSLLIATADEIKKRKEMDTG